MEKLYQRGKLDVCMASFHPEDKTFLRADLVSQLLLRKASLETFILELLANDEGVTLGVRFIFLK